MAQNILVIEDDSLISTFLETKLTSRGYTTFVASSTNEAREILKNQSINFIILDIILPHEDGLTFLEFLKDEKKYKKIPVMILSNLSQEGEIKRATKLGAVDYIIKAERTPSEIVDKITAHLADSSSEK